MPAIAGLAALQQTIREEMTALFAHGLAELRGQTAQEQAELQAQIVELRGGIAELQGQVQLIQSEQQLLPMRLYSAFASYSGPTPLRYLVGTPSDLLPTTRSDLAAFTGKRLLLTIDEFQAAAQALKPPGLPG